MSIAEVNRHSCSLAVSLESQGLFINDFTSRVALELLRQLLMLGQIAHHGAMENLDTMRKSPIPVDPAAWKRLGYVSAETRSPSQELLAARLAVKCG